MGKHFRYYYINKQHNLELKEYTFCFVFLLLEQTVKILRHQWAYSCEKAKQELDYNPRSLKEGLEEMLAWLKSVGLIKY